MEESIVLINNRHCKYVIQCYQHTDERWYFGIFMNHKGGSWGYRGIAFAPLSSICNRSHFYHSRADCLIVAANYILNKLDEYVRGGNGLKFYGLKKVIETINDFKQNIREGIMNNIEYTEPEEVLIATDSQESDYEADQNETRNTTTLDLEVHLNEEDLIKLANQITELDHEIDDLETEMEQYKSMSNTAKKHMDSKDEERRKLSREYRMGTSLRTFSVYWIDDLSTDERVYYDINTDKELKREPMHKTQDSATLFQMTDVPQNWDEDI